LIEFACILRLIIACRRLASNGTPQLLASVDRLPARLAIPTIVALSLALWALTLAIRRKSRRRARQFHPPTAIASGRRLVRGRGGKTCAGRAGDLLLGSRRPKDSAAHDQSADDAENRTPAATRQNGELNLLCCTWHPSEEMSCNRPGVGRKLTMLQCNMRGSDGDDRI